MPFIEPRQDGADKGRWVLGEDQESGGKKEQTQKCNAYSAVLARRAITLPPGTEAWLHMQNLRLNWPGARNREACMSLPTPLPVNRASAAEILYPGENNLEGLPGVAGSCCFQTFFQDF